MHLRLWCLGALYGNGVCAKCLPVCLLKDWCGGPGGHVLQYNAKPVCPHCYKRIRLENVYSWFLVLCNWGSLNSHITRLAQYFLWKITGYFPKSNHLCKTWKLEERGVFLGHHGYIGMGKTNKSREIIKKWVFGVSLLTWNYQPQVPFNFK